MPTKRSFLFFPANQHEGAKPDTLTIVVWFVSETPSPLWVGLSVRVLKRCVGSTEGA